MENYNKYEDISIDSNDIELILIDKLDSIELNKILSAYEISENICSKKLTPFGVNCFNHATRVCYLLINELNIYEPEMLCAAILHDIFNVSNDISTEIIDYNFGPYTTYIIQSMTESQNLKTINDNISVENFLCNDDFLVIAGAEHLDHLRCISYDVTGIILKYLDDISKYFLPLLEKTENHNLIYLKHEILKHRNKILG